MAGRPTACPPRDPSLLCHCTAVGFLQLFCSCLFGLPALLQRVDFAIAQHRPLYTLFPPFALFPLLFFPFIAVDAPALQRLPACIFLQIKTLRDTVSYCTVTGMRAILQCGVAAGHA